MAVYINDYRQLPPNAGGLPVIDYETDTLADIQELPGPGEIAFTSKAYVYEANTTFVLKRNGWEEMIFA